MATYPIKMLKDEKGTPFVPLITLDAIETISGETIKDRLDKKLETSNLIAGDNIGLSVNGNNITISSTGVDANVDNLINYYKKTETYSKGEIDAIVSRIEEEMNAWNSNAIARLQTLTTLDETSIETTLSGLAGDTSE